MSPRSAILQSKVMKTLISQQNFNNFNKNLNISVESWLICIKPTEQASFFWGSQYESKECYAMIKTDENLNISAESWLIWQILQKRWLRLAQNGQFWSFCRFFHLFPQNEAQIDSEWPISPDSQLFTSFEASHFWEISKIFIPDITMFSVFQLFQIFTPKRPKWPIMALPPKWLWAPNGSILVKFQQKLKYLSRILTDLQNIIFWAQNESKEAMLWSKLINTLILRNDRSAPNLQNNCFQNESKECCAIQNNFSQQNLLIRTKVFQLLQIISHWSGSKWPTMANFAQKSGLDWLQMANFVHFAGTSFL